MNCIEGHSKIFTELIILICGISKSSRGIIVSLLANAWYCNSSCASKRVLTMSKEPRNMRHLKLALALFGSFSFELNERLIVCLQTKSV
jgi:hypothetical protein